MITIRVVGLNYTINQYFFDCPFCSYEQEFISVSSFSCRKCKKLLPAVGGFFESDLTKRVRHLIMWHRQKNDMPDSDEVEKIIDSEREGK